MIKDVGIDPSNELVLLNSVYDLATNQLYLKMYNIKTERLEILTDQSGFIPYTYFKTNDRLYDQNQFSQFLKENISKYEAQVTEMTDLLEDTEVPVIKLYSSNVYYVYENLTKKLNDIQQYEYLIKMHESYIYDNQFIFSSNYNLKNRTLYGILPTLTKDQNYFLGTVKFKAGNASLISSLFSGDDTSKSIEYQKYLSNYILLLNQPIPDFKRMALDIEIWSNNNNFPDVTNPVNPIISVAYVDNRGKKYIVTSQEFLSDILHTANDNVLKRVMLDLMFENHDLKFVSTEKDLIKHIFKMLNEYPLIVTFNGDNFDLAYITQRADLLEIETENNPILFKKSNKSKGTKYNKNPISLKNSIHLDLFQLYQNISLQNYAFNARYKEYSLNAISNALLNKKKLEYNVPLQLTKIDKMFDINKAIRYDTIIEKAKNSLSEMYRYNLHDATLTMELTTFSNNLPMNLITILSRITKTAIEDICRYGISNWARNMLYYEHRKRNYIIPTSRDCS